MAHMTHFFFQVLLLLGGRDGEGKPLTSVEVFLGRRGRNDQGCSPVAPRYGKFCQV